MNLQKDLREFVELLSKLDVHFLVVGAFAVAGHSDIGGLRIPFISREMLKRNKAASGRAQDLADLEHL